MRVGLDLHKAAWSEPKSGTLSKVFAISSLFTSRSISPRSTSESVRSLDGSRAASTSSRSFSSSVLLHAPMPDFLPKWKQLQRTSESKHSTSIETTFKHAYTHTTCVHARPPKILRGAHASTICIHARVRVCTCACACTFNMLGGHAARAR